MSSYLTARIRAHPRIRVHTGTTVRELDGDHALASIVVENTTTAGRRRMDCRGLFCFIGADPVFGWLTGVDKDPDVSCAPAARCRLPGPRDELAELDGVEHAAGRPAAASSAASR
jgi:hypothetical protein